MANALFDRFKQALSSFTAAGLGAAIDVQTANVKCVLTRTAPNIATAQFFSDITSPIGDAGGATRADCPQLPGVIVDSAGVVDGNDVAFTGIPAGAAIPYLVIFIDSGADATSVLIAYIDTAIGLPTTPNGGPITVAWSNGASKIYAL